MKQWLALPLILLIGMSGSALTARVSIKVQEDGKVITCTVPRHPDNRTVYLGVFGHTSSGRPLDGERAAITHQLRLRRMPACLNEEDDTVVAFCEVLFVPHHSQIATTEMLCLK